MKTARIDVYIPRGRRTGYVFQVFVGKNEVARSLVEDTKYGALMSAIKAAKSVGCTSYRMVGKAQNYVIMSDEKFGFLKKDQQERFNSKRGWMAVAYRVVGLSGADLFQPWCRTKGEARDTAQALDITLLAEIK